MQIAHILTDLIGNTPLLALERYAPGARPAAPQRFPSFAFSPVRLLFRLFAHQNPSIPK